MRFWQVLLTVFAMFVSLSASAQTVEISAIYIDDNGVEVETRNDFSGQAPLSVSFRANPQDMEGLDPTYEWHFRMELMPNAFSPNGDTHNDVYKAKEYQSIVEFHAYIFNRWGQKLFEWTNPAEGWDGNYNGNPVKEGVYFVVVKARGADGIVYNIRKDVNLLRGYTKTE